LMYLLQRLFEFSQIKSKKIEFFNYIKFGYIIRKKLLP
jgi:hypothetical protein